MFRWTKSKRWGAEDVAALYRGVLRREPNAQEIDALTHAIADANTPEQALKDMLSSHEFGVMVLPNLINEYVTSIPANPVFFLHVPKTAGTSFRLALTDAMGTPAFLLYVQSSWRGYKKNDTMNFWPLWAGHAGISTFPTTHRGITVFRESRSRVLSSYRQQERELASGTFSLTRFSRDDSLMAQPTRLVTAADPFSKWVELSRGALQWFVEMPTDSKHQLWDGRASSAWVRSLDATELRENLSRSLNRIDAAAWAHDPVAMSRSIDVITGKSSNVSISHHNPFVEEDVTKPTVLTAEDRDHLDRIARAEKILTDLAVDKGLIPPIDPDFAQHEFESTAKRLGFTFA